MIIFEKKIDSAIDQTKSIQAMLEHLKEMQKAATSATDEDMQQFFAEAMAACIPVLRAGKEAMGEILQCIVADLGK